VKEKKRKEKRKHICRSFCYFVLIFLCKQKNKLIFDSIVSKIFYAKTNGEFPNKNNMCYKGEKDHE